MKYSSIVWPVIVLTFSIPAFSQNVRVHYQSFENGIERPGGASSIECTDQLTSLSDEKASLRTFLDFSKNLLCQMIRYEDQLYRMDTPFDSLPAGHLTGKTDTILGYACKQMEYSYFSNSIEVFFTEEAGYRGSPYSQFLPSANGLVLKVIINGNRETRAVKTEPVYRETPVSYPYDESNLVTAAKFEEIRIKSRYITLPVFTNQQIHFDPEKGDPEWMDQADGQVYSLSNGTVVLKKIKLPDITRQGCYTYIHLTCRSNGDAYDRTGSVFAILPDEGQSMLDALRDSISVLPFFSDKSDRKYRGFRREDGFTPALEWMRFFTSFGVDHFNDKRVIHNYPWEESAHYDQEISAFVPDDRSEIWVGVFIGNYDKGGHIIDLDLRFYPSFDEEPKDKKWILPLFNTVNIMEMSGQEYPRLFATDTLSVAFTVPEGIRDVQLHFTTTGHGGWGNGDEFNPTLNEIFVDGEAVYKVVPWRTDCATYRLYNPASGNFGNGMSSSDFSRSNWCPAVATPPFIIPLPDVKPGNHTVKIAIDQGPDEGGSFNSWCVSGQLTGIWENKK